MILNPDQGQTYRIRTAQHGEETGELLDNNRVPMRDGDTPYWLMQITSGERTGQVVKVPLVAAFDI